MSQVAIITPVREGQADALKEHLRTKLPRDKPPNGAGPTETAVSPFTGILPPTHFARFVVIEMDKRHYLFFSSRFDAPAREYLRSMAATTDALSIWSHCQIRGQNEPLTHGDLERYLCDHRHWSPAQYVVSAIAPDVTVTDINRALALRAELSQFVPRASRLDPAALAHAFRQLPAIRALMSR